MLPLRYGILAEAVSFASTSLQQRQSISLALFFQCSHFRSGRQELFCKKNCLRPATLLRKRLWNRCFPVDFAKSLRTTFFTEHLQWLLLTFAWIEISHSNAACNKLAAETWICLVSFYGGELWSERLHCHMYFPQTNHFFHWNINVTRIFSISFTRSKFHENLKQHK